MTIRNVIGRRDMEIQLDPNEVLHCPSCGEVWCICQPESAETWTCPSCRETWPNEFACPNCNLQREDGPVNETVRLWSQDYTEVLYTTDDREAAKRFFAESGQDWLPIVIDYGTNWAQRWSGRLEMTDGKVAANQDREYLKYMIECPVIDLTTG